MRRIVIIFLLFITIDGHAQLNAQYSLFTDCDIYISGETILFNLFTPEEAQPGIAKLDLINSGGKIIMEINKKIINHQVDGYIHLPDSLSTGTYLLCTSEKDHKKLFIKELLICNRFKGLTESLPVLRSSSLPPSIEIQASVGIEGLENKYKTRDKVHAKIHLSPEVRSKLKDDLFVAAIEKIPGYDSHGFVKDLTRKPNKNTTNEGVTVDGWAVDPATGKAFNNGCIMLSVPDSVPGLRYFITQDDGYFNFQLNNYYGNIPIVVQGFDPDKKRLLKLTLNHNDSLPVALTVFDKQSINEDLRKLIADKIEAAILCKIFNYQEVIPAHAPLKMNKEYPFYGIPTEVVRPGLFIDLPDFTEISRELLPGVKFRAFNRIPTLQILNPATLNYYAGQPLLLLDGIPVQDLNVIKNLGSKEINRIDICRRERYFGDLYFPGVVAIYSKDHEYNRIAESEDLIKQQIETIQPQDSLNTTINHVANEPDLRKVLLWNCALPSEETISVDFNTSDIRGTYQLIVRGQTTDGTLVYKNQVFEVN